MALILSLSLIWMLSGTGGALQCVNQTNIECKSSDYCVTAAVQSGGGKEQIKHCGSSKLCATNHTFSFNFGTGNINVYVQCCKTDNCNKGTVKYPDAQKENSLECLTCNDTDVCKKTVQCVGNQDSCLSGYVAEGNSMKKVSGCASKNLCDLASELNFLNFTSRTCSSAWTVAANVVLVLLGLGSLIVW